MKTLVTGADGFIGSHLAKLLVMQGNEVTALCQYNSFGHRGGLDTSPLADQMKTRSRDVRDVEFCHTLLRGANTVYRLAALIGIPNSYVAPVSYLATNVMGTSNFCQAALRAGGGSPVVNPAEIECVTEQGKKRN